MNYTELNNRFNNALQAYREDKKTYGAFVQFESLAPAFLDDITEELVSLLHPEYLVDQSLNNIQQYTLEIEAEDFQGNVTIERRCFFGSRDDANSKMSHIMSGLVCHGAIGSISDSRGRLL